MISLLRIPLLQMLPNRRKLNITRPLINRANLTIPKVLLRKPLPHKAHATHPLNRLAAHTSSDLTRHELRHGSIHDEVLARLLLARGVVDKGAGGLDLGPGLGELMLHGLELADEGTELLAVVPGVAVGC